jgi:DNA-binding transcriptional LysR family regulator
MPKLNQRQVEAFRAVMLTGGITSAAQLMSVTQPAVSRLIRDLQVAVNLPLFERVGTRLLPTSEALSLSHEVERSFVGLERIVQTAADLRSRRAGSLRIAAYPALATSFLPRVVADFLKDRPKLHISVHGLGSRIVLDQVGSGQCDIGFVSDVLEFPNVTSQSVGGLTAVAAVPADHRLARRAVLTPKDFRGERFIGLGQYILLRHRIDHAFAAHRVERTGVSIVDPLTAEEYKARNVAIRPFSPRIAIEFKVLYPAQRTPSGVALEFIAVFRRALAVFRRTRASC